MVKATNSRLVGYNSSQVRILLVAYAPLTKWERVQSRRSSALLAQSVEHQTFNLRVVGSSPTRGFVVESDIK